MGLKPSAQAHVVPQAPPKQTPGVVADPETRLWPNWYLNAYPDLLKAFGPNNAQAAIDHYRIHGIKEGRSPNPFFLPEFYRAKYPDLQKGFGNDNEALLRHWIDAGRHEGRQGSPLLEPAAYKASHPDVCGGMGSGYEKLYERAVASELKAEAVNPHKGGDLTKELTDAGFAVLGLVVRGTIGEALGIKAAADAVEPLAVDVWNQYFNDQMEKGRTEAMGRAIRDGLQAEIGQRGGIEKFNNSRETQRDNAAGERYERRGGRMAS